tara:strand:+ start:870 stop:1127 length:258 start_codon:yes stop_codon:yes gene_type:complete
MKTRYIIIIIILILGSVGGYLYYDNYYRCSLNNREGCDISCESDKDCKMSYCSCINIDEDIFSWNNVAVLCAEMPDCSCVEGVCE